MKEKLLKFFVGSFVGKNKPHLARVVGTFVGGLLLMTPLFSPETPAIDPGVGVAITEIHAPSADQVKDGLTVGELISAGLGLLMIWGSAFVSYLRAKNLDWLGNTLGPIFGRSLPSLGRRALVVAAAFFARVTAQPDLSPEAFSNMSVGGVLISLGLIAWANWSSATEDAKRNPVESAPEPYPIDAR
jgi:hypothetical protein